MGGLPRGDYEAILLLMKQVRLCIPDEVPWPQVFISRVNAQSQNHT